MADKTEENAPAPVFEGMAATNRHLARSMFDEKHLTKLHERLSVQWEKMQSLSAAMRLMEQHGVVLTPEDVERLSDMDEASQISALVGMMPQQSNEQFQNFFLQLQLLVSTATRIRRALEEGRSDLVDEALADADNTGISPYILRMAIVQAGAEVSGLKAHFSAWMKDADTRMSRLIRGQEDAMHAQKKLAAAQAEYMKFNSAQSDKARKVLMSFASGSDSGLKAGCFNGWLTYVKTAQQEAHIRAEYEDKIERAKQRTIDLKAENLKGIRGMMQRKAKELEATLSKDVVSLWKEAIDEQKADAALAGNIAEMEARLKAAQGDQVKNSKNVLARMQAAQEGGLVGLCFQSLVAYHKDYLKNKEMEDRVKQSEQRMKKFMKEKSDGAKKVLDSFSGSSDTGLLHVCITAWIEYYQDIKKENELSELLAQQQAKHAAFADRNKGAGKSLMERARLHMENMLMLTVWNHWRLDARMEVTVRTYHAQIEGKRAQLLSVQQMFRRFATQLESNLKHSEASTVDLRNPTKGEKPPRKMKKGEQSASLPDINSSKRSPKSGRSKTSSNGIRTPTGNAYPS